MEKSFIELKKKSAVVVGTTIRSSTPRGRNTIVQSAMIKEKTKLPNESVGEVLAYNADRRSYKIRIGDSEFDFMENPTYITQEALTGMGLRVSGSRVYRDNPVKVRYCSGCGNEDLFYNEQCGDYYCPVCYDD